MTAPEPQLKNLKVLVNDVEYVNADFAEVTVSDGPNGVRVQALPIVLPKSSGPSSSIIEALTAAVSARAGAKAAASEAAQTDE
jgi:hypothetical protein